METCEICGVEKPTAQALNAHKRMVHGERECKICGATVDGGLSGMARHAAAEHGSRSKKTAVPPADESSDPGTLFELPAEQAPVFDPKSEKSKAKRSGWRDKMWGTGEKRSKKPAATEPAPTTKERRPIRRTKRSSTSDIFSMAWAGIGSGLIRTQWDIPVGRTMQFQAPVAGSVLDRLVANTFVDRLLQPVASRTREIEDAAALFALPALIATIERSPELAVALEPLVRQALRVNLVAMAPIVKRQREEEKRYADAIAELGITGDGESDPVEAMLAAIFAPVPDQPPPPHAENGAGRIPDGAMVG